MLRFGVKVRSGVRSRAGAAVCGEFLGDFSEAPGDRPHLPRLAEARARGAGGP